MQKIKVRSFVASLARIIPTPAGQFVCGILSFAFLQCAALGQVSNLNDSGPGSLRQAIADAANGATITCSVAGTIGLSTVADSTYGPSALLIDKSITIIGNGITIARSNTVSKLRLFYVKTNCTLILSNLTVSGGSAIGGKGNDGWRAAGGGGGAGLGGAIYNQGRLVVQNCTLSSNTAVGGNGGGFDNWCGAYYDGGGGGGMNGDAGCLGCSPNSACPNQPFWQGGPSGGGRGGDYYGDKTGRPGSYGGGGGGGSSSGNGGVPGGNGGAGGFGGGGGGGGGIGYPTSAANAAGGFGGGASGAGTPYDGGTGGGGGGMGGAIFNEGGTVAVTNSTISFNIAMGGSSGCGSDSGPTMVQHGDGGAGYGAGIFNLNGTVNLVHATMDGNTVVAGGGCGAAGFAGGAALYNLQVTNVPVLGTSSVFLKNCILADSTGGSDAVNDGGTITGSTNLVQSASGFPVGVVSFTSSPLLSALQNNGGPTLTQYPKPGSAAIDAGQNVSGLTIDQRGSNRVVRSLADLGAYEVASNIAPIVSVQFTNRAITNFFSYSFTFATNTFLDANANEGQVLTYTATGLPPGLSINSATRTISGRPQQVGTFTVSVIATDNGIPNLSATNTFTLETVFAPNTEPIFTAGPDQLVLENSGTQPAFNGNGTIIGWGWEPSYYANTFTVSRPFNLSGAVSVVAGASHFVAAKLDGTVVAWGNNQNQQCTVPGGLNNVKAVAAGYYSSFALKKDGTVVSWGYQFAPVPSGLTNVTAISVGTAYALALKNDGTIVGWGNNYSGELNIPAGLSNVVAIASPSTGSHSLALKSDGTVVAWGSNSGGQCNVPAGLSNVVAIAAGGNVSLALKSDGTIAAWGYNGYGQLNIPASVTNVAFIAAGGSKCGAVKKDGTVVTWGNNPYENIPSSYGNYPQPSVSGATALAISTGDGSYFGTQLCALQGPAWPWATDIKAGYGDEGYQSLNFIVSNDNPSLFSVQPTINTNGILFYTPAVNAFGVATVTVSLHDNGGTSGGGIDTSTPITFTITVQHVNRSPVLMTAITNQLLYFGSPFSLTFPANTFSNWDAQFGETLSYTAQNLHSGLTLDSATRTFSGVPAVYGSSNIVLTAADNGTPPLSAVNNFTITVTNTFAPGPNVATLTLSNTIWAPGLNYNWQIKDATGTPGVGHDLIRINGTLDLSETADFKINLWTLSGASTSGPATNFDRTLEYTWLLASTTAGIIGFDPAKLQIVTGASNGTGGFANLIGNGSFFVEVSETNLLLHFVPAAPFAQTEPATAVNGTNATLHATVNPNGRPTTVFFEYGTNLSYATSLYVTNLPASRNPSAVSLKLLGLDPQSTYNFRVVAANTGDLIYGTNATFSTAALPDATAPIVTIASPAANWSTNVANITVTGTAKDDARVWEIFYSVNNSTFSNITFNSAALVNWSKNIKLKAGTNTFAIKATDRSGKQSAVMTRTFFFDVRSPLTLVTNGVGSILSTASTLGTPTNNAPLLVGRSYTVTAVPGPNNVFSNWSGGITSTNKVLTFTMQSNLLLRANFVRNPFLDTAGTYNGLFFEKTNVAHHSSGFLTMSLATNFGFTGKITIGGDTLPFVGAFNVNGLATQTVARAQIGKSPLTLVLTNGVELRGTVADGTNWIARLCADKATFNSTNLATAFAKRYTMLIPGDGTAATSPTGYGFATLSVSTNGLVNAAITLADGSIGTQTVPISQNGEWPLYLQLYKSARAFTNLLTTLASTNKAYYRGSLLGWITFNNDAPTGSVSWIKTCWTNAIYANGFTNEAAVLGSVYVPPALNVRALNVTHGTITLNDGNLAADLTRNFTNAPNNLMTITPTTESLKLTVTPTTGLLKGSFKHPAKAGYVPVIGGVILQQQKIGAGYFMGTNQAGSMLLEGN